ncbi:MAG: hypothetical protein BWZ09_02798 [Alphaproteobacteria bacterium ADurb.BinA305]|nr:MAG: hypothetical protein BWZ09_02798 [Alphaproteobacteria bacterium ADurb.BinA305]
MAGARFRDHVLDDERVARRVACDGGEHRRVVLRTGVQVLEVRLDAVDVGHREDARSDQLVVRDGDEGRTQEQVEQRGQPVLPIRRRGEAEPVPRGAAVDHRVERARGDVVGLVEDEQAEAAEEGVELRPLPAHQRLDDGHCHGRGALLAVAEQSGLDAELVLQLPEPLLGEVEGVDEDERRRTQLGDRAHAHARLAAAARNDDRALRDLGEPIDGDLLVVAQAERGHLELHVRQHARVLAGDDEPLLRGRAPEHVDGPARKA